VGGFEQRLSPYGVKERLVSQGGQVWRGVPWVGRSMFTIVSEGEELGLWTYEWVLGPFRECSMALVGWNIVFFFAGNANGVSHLRDLRNS